MSYCFCPRSEFKINKIVDPDPGDKISDTQHILYELGSLNSSIERNPCKFSKIHKVTGTMWIELSLYNVYLNKDLALKVTLPYQVDRKRELVNTSLLTSEIEDTDLGIRNTPEIKQILEKIWEIRTLSRGLFCLYYFLDRRALIFVTSPIVVTHNQNNKICTWM